MNWRSRICSRGACDAKPAGVGGFTLLELLIVMAIMGMVGALIVSGRPSGSSSVNVRLAAETLASALRVARAQAITQGRPVGMVLDTNRRRYGIEQAPQRPLPDGLTFTLLTGRGDVLSPAQGRIRFFPDGSSTGGRITIHSAAGKSVVGIDWLSGRVSVADRL